MIPADPRTEQTPQSEPDETGRAEFRSRNTSGRALATNVLSGYLTLALGALAGFVTTPVLLSALGVARFGTWSLLVATAGYIGLLELGLGAATTNRIAATEARGLDTVQEIFSTSLALFAVVAALALAVATAASFVLPAAFHLPREIASHAVIAFILLGAAQATTALVTPFTALFIGTGRMYLSNLGGAGVSIGASVAQAAVAVAGGGLPALAAVQLVGGVLTLLLFRARARRACPEVNLSFGQASKAVGRRLLWLGSRNGVSTIAGTLAFGSDLALIGLLLTPVAAAAYAVALSGYQFLLRLATTAAGTIGPSHAYQAANADDDERFRLLGLSLLVTFVLAIYGALTFGVFSDGLLQLWLGHAPKHASVILVVLCSVLILQAPGYCAYTFLVSSERVTDAMRLVVFGCTLNILASVILTATVGVVGPALGSLISVAIFEAFLMPRSACRVVGRGYARLLKAAAVPMLLPTTLLAITLGVGRTYVSAGPGILIVIAAASVPYFLALWLTPSVRDLRNQLARRV